MFLVVKLLLSCLESELSLELKSQQSTPEHTFIRATMAAVDLAAAAPLSSATISGGVHPSLNFGVYGVMYLSWNIGADL